MPVPTPPHKILILGNGGSGKTVLAEQLRKKLATALLSLDSIYWTQGWTHQCPALYLKTVDDFMKNDHWIIEGTPMLGLQRRIEQATLIIFIDLPRIQCIKNAVIRSFSHRFNKKKNPSGCPAIKINRATIQWIWQFNSRQKKTILEQLADTDKPLITLHSRKEVQQFIKKWSSVNRHPRYSPNKT